MEQNLEKNQITLTKNKISTFIHDMKELEQQQFTLKETRAKCISRRQTTSENAKHKISEAENACRQTDINLNQALKNRIPKPKEVSEPKKVREPFGLFVSLILLLFVYTPIAIAIAIMIAYSPIMLLLPEAKDANDTVVVLGSFLALLLAGFNNIMVNRRYRRYKKKLKKYLQYLESNKNYEQQEENIKNCQEQCKLAQKMSENAKIYNSDAKTQIEKLNLMIEFLSLHISKIEDQKNQLYTVGIVPPDYRKLDCLIEFDQMFRNDLVDTVREAIKTYEERVFRGEVVRGVEKIYNMLGNLSASMQNIEKTLYSIQSEVRLMSDEIYNIASATESFQSSMLSESRAARYAAEALQKSQEKCESYLRSQYYG